MNAGCVPASSQYAQHFKFNLHAARFSLYLMLFQSWAYSEVSLADLYMQYSARGPSNETFVWFRPGVTRRILFITMAPEGIALLPQQRASGFHDDVDGLYKLQTCSWAETG
eukprot:661816-Pelagomonas_calceolata.AAC.6